ncbi:MAG: helix-turn-helix domain-containing protein [Candidatus Woesearchaeota archaeon]|jgi:predicted DNA binding protein
MYKFSFKIRHRNCAETGLSIKFPNHYINVVDIQSKGNQKQYFYYITGKNHYFDAIIKHLKTSKTYNSVREIERSVDTLLLLVIINQSKNYVQNVITKHHGFFLALHSVYGGYEYWHVGLLEKEIIPLMKKELDKIGEVKTLYIGEAEFAPSLLSTQQKKIFQYAYQQGYYQLPRKTTIAKIAKALKLSPATVGEHLLRAENKLISSQVNLL